MKSWTFATIALVASMGSAHGAFISSAGDPALAAASLETFNSPSTGGYTSLSLADVTVSATGFSVSVGGNGEFTPPNPAGDKFLLIDTHLLTFTFNNAVSAFGIVIGATNSEQTISAYDAGGNLLESAIIPNQVATMPFPYSGFYGFSSTTSNIAKFTVTNTNDAVVYDDLYYTSSAAAVPEPTSIAMWGLSLVGAVLIRRKRRLMTVA